MVKLLCTASLLLAFSMSSFASTNDQKKINAVEVTKTTNELKSTANSADLEDDSCIEVEFTWVEYVVSTDGGTEISDGIDIKFGRITFIWCF